MWILQSEITENCSKRFESDKNNVFVLLPTLKSVINEIENNADGKPEYQGQKLKFYLSEKEYLKNHCINIVKAIVPCYEDRYSSLLSDSNKSSGISDFENMEISDDTSMLFDVCRVLNTKVWPKLQEGSKDNENLSLQLNSVKNLFEKFNNMEVFHPVSIDSLIDGYSDIVQNAHCYLEIEHTKLMKLWSKLVIINKSNEDWEDIMLLLELCLCSLFSNATLERFFSHLKVVKTQLRSKLSTECLNSIMRIRMKGLSLEEFKKRYASKCADFWYNSKACPLNQFKRK